VAAVVLLVSVRDCLLRERRRVVRVRVRERLHADRGSVTFHAAKKKVQ
jgi:hypothetical protein